MRAITTEGQSFTDEEISTEEWRPIPSKPGYDASSIGRIRRWIKTGRWDRGQPLETPVLCWVHVNKTFGYCTVSIKKVNETVHPLVCEAFHGPCPDGLECAHEDGVRDNNRFTNLKWKTPKENQHDRYRHGTMIRGNDVWSAILDEEAVREIRAAPKGTLPAMVEKYGVKYWTVIGIRQGKSWKHVA